MCAELMVALNRGKLRQKSAPYVGTQNTGSTTSIPAGRNHLAGALSIVVVTQKTATTVELQWRSVQSSSGYDRAPMGSRQAVDDDDPGAVKTHFVQGELVAYFEQTPCR